MKLFLIIFLFYFTLNAQSIENKFIKNKLISIYSIDKTIKIDLVNSNKNKNFFNKNFYGSLKKCYLQKEIAYKLKKAQKILQNKHKNYSLLVMDCARPRSVSWKMYNQLKNTPFKKYVANPIKGSMHNYGAAVDIMIVDANDKHLDFGMNPFYKEKVSLFYNVIKYKLFPDINKKQEKNRKLLKEVMIKAGFKSISLEWWHFNGYSKSIIRKKYIIIE